MIRFSATASPSGLTFVGSNGRTYAIPSNAAAYATARDKVRALKAKFSKDRWAELTNLADPTVGPFFVGATVKVTNGPTAKVVSNKRGNIVVEATPKAKAPRDIDRSGSGDPQQPSAKPRKPAPPKPSKPKPPAGGVKLPASLAAIESAETMIHLGALANSQHGFQTGIENYAQAMWGTKGLNAAMAYFRDPSNYGQREMSIVSYRQDNEGFMRGLAQRLFPSGSAEAVMSQLPSANEILHGGKAEQINPRKFRAALRQLDKERRAKAAPTDPVGIAMTKLIEQGVNDEIERDFERRRLSGAQLETLRCAYERAYPWDKAKSLHNPPVQRVIAPEPEAAPARFLAGETVRFKGGDHIYGGTFKALTVEIDGEESKMFSADGQGGLYQAQKYCEERFGFTPADLRKMRGKAGLYLPVEDVQLREVMHSVNVIVRGLGQKSFSDYQPAAIYVKNLYGFDDSDLMAIYHDYKADYDGVSDDEDED